MGALVDIYRKQKYSAVMYRSAGELGALVDIYRTHSEKLPTEGSLATLDKLTIVLEGDAGMSIHRQNQFRIELITILNNLVHFLG